MPCCASENYGRMCPGADVLLGKQQVGQVSAPALDLSLVQWTAQPAARGQGLFLEWDLPL